MLGCARKGLAHLCVHLFVIIQLSSGKKAVRCTVVALRPSPLA